MDESLVTVVIPVYNTGQSAKKLAEKVLKNSNTEVILVDDGSTDNSMDVLGSIKNKRIKLYNIENGGPSVARNFGIGNAKGKYLMFLDSDDDIKEDFIKKMVKEMEKEGVALAVSGVEYRKLKQKTAENVYLNDFPYKENEDNKSLVLRSLFSDGRMYPAFNKIFDAEVVRKNKLQFDESMKFGEDTKFVLDYLKCKNGRISFVSEPLYIYNAGTSTSTAKKMEKEWRNWRKCFSNLRKWIGRKSTLNEKRLLVMIYLKWKASWLKAKLS